jgi:tetratricopeptide (TPR) repeat protein
MKFICNNCGFSAEIPEKRSNCPMCASSNVSVTDERSVADEKKEDQSTESEIRESAQEAIEGLNDNPEEKKDNVRSEKITLTDNFFDQKPNKEEQEIADVLKELYPDEEKKSGGIKMPDWRILAGVGAAVVILLIVVLFSVFSSDESEDVATEAVEIEEDVEEVKNEEVKNEEVVANSEEDAQEEKDPEDIEEKKVVQQDPEEEKEEEVEVEEPEKKVAEVKKAPPVVKKRKEPPKRNIVAKKKSMPKTEKKTDNTKKYDEFVQLGHSALGQKRYTDALHEYKNAMRLKPRSGKIYKFIGIAYAYLQNQTQACNNYRKYIQLTPNAKDKNQVQAFLEACP